MRSRKRKVSQRPVSKKNTNMVKESKYTVSPHQPPGANVASELTTNAMAMPNATGKSMPTRRALRSCQALFQ